MVAKYKSFNADSDAVSDVNSVSSLSRTATASINIRTDPYFDNDTILNQFERLSNVRIQTRIQG